MNLLDLFEADLPAHIKPSDIPPAMRNRKLTMKDIEAERPKGAYRFRVGEKEFMDLAAAKEFARGTGQQVYPIREAQKKNSSPRVEKILKQLRMRHPQARDDLEALIYDFRSGQQQDRQDISRLDAENDQEEASIEEIERMIQAIKSRRAEIAEEQTIDESSVAVRVARDEKENVVLDEAGKDACYHKVRSRYKVWPSAYASGALVQCRKKGAANWGNKSK